MKKLKNLVLDFIKEDFDWKYYGANLLFLAICITVNYIFEFESKIYSPHKRHWYIYPVNFLYYFVPFAFSALSYLYILPKEKRSANLKDFFGLKVFCLFLMLAVYTGFFHHRDYIEQHSHFYLQYYLKIVTNNFVAFALMSVMAYLYWKYVDKKPKNNFYGFTSHNVDLKPYFLMIAIMTPLICFASTLEDFLEMYPIYYPHLANEYLKTKGWILMFIFEINYGLDFVATELFFRGLLIIGLSSILGRACVVPMVTTYCVFHFGKPVGETISSIIGGYILGILALRTRSIYGGIIIHLAVAYMMEVGGYLGNSFFINSD
jgi:membrane protease YdiL (CAAX protease family)